MVAANCWLHSWGKKHLYFFNFGAWLLSQTKQVVKVELPFKIECQAEEGVDELDQAPHELARLNESPNHSHLRLNEEGLPDRGKTCQDLDGLPGRAIFSTDAAKSDRFLLEESAELRHTTRELSAHVFLNLLPRLHCLHLFKDDLVPISERLKEDAGHAGDSQYSR